MWSTSRHRVGNQSEPAFPAPGIAAVFQAVHKWLDVKIWREKKKQKSMSSWQVGLACFQIINGYLDFSIDRHLKSERVASLRR